MKKLLFIALDNTLVDFLSGVATFGADVQADFAGRLDEIPGVFSRMIPIAGGVEAHAKLCEKFDVYILSTAPWENPSAWSDKLVWVRNHLGQNAHKRLILSHHKNLNVGDYLIDDREANGAGKFSGKLILFGSAHCPDWASAERLLADV